MKIVVQRVLNAAVHVNGSSVGHIEQGLVVLLGIKDGDHTDQIPKAIQKIINMRIFNDDEGKMNRSLLHMNGQLLIVSQFTLYGNAQKGNRPSFISAAPPHLSEPLYQQFVSAAIDSIGPGKVATGVFGADMQLSLVNDGPVTIIWEY